MKLKRGATALLPNGFMGPLVAGALLALCAVLTDPVNAQPMAQTQSEIDPSDVPASVQSSAPAQPSAWTPAGMARMAEERARRNMPPTANDADPKPFSAMSTASLGGSVYSPFVSTAPTSHSSPASIGLSAIPDGKPASDGPSLLVTCLTVIGGSGALLWLFRQF